MKIEDNIIQSIKAGGVGVLPTDTIYGIVASIKLERSLKRIYKVKDRDWNKKLIHLVSSAEQLSSLGVKISKEDTRALSAVWPGPVSVELACDDTKPYLHKGTNCIAVRMPEPQWLRDVIAQTGPIVATSANISGQPVSSDINEIKNQLPGLDFYLEGPVSSEPSRLARLKEDGSIEWLSR